MNMTTNIDNIPLKTNSNDIPNDDSNDPVVKDILNEFEKEFKVNNQSSQPLPPKPQNDYVINYSQPAPACPIPIKKKIINSFYNEEFLRKTAIIIIIIALIFSPIIFATFVDKLPESLKDIVDTNNYYIKLLLAFIAIYLLFTYNLL